MKLRGKVALVTGSGRGLGRAYALRLAALGADVVINDVNLDAAREFNEPLSAPTVMDEVRACGGRSLGIQADVTKKDQVDAMVEQIVRDLGRIDILVNNAGGALTPFERGFASMMPEADARFILDVNLMSTIFCCQAVAPHMKAQKSGKIINVSSQAGLRGNDTGALAHYCVSKAGVAEYTRLLAGELGPHQCHGECDCARGSDHLASHGPVRPRRGPRQDRGAREADTVTPARNARGLRQGRGVPRDRPLRLRDRAGDLRLRRDGPVAVVAVSFCRPGGRISNARKHRSALPPMGGSSLWRVWHGHSETPSSLRSRPAQLARV